MKKIALALSLMLVLSACGAPSSEATGKPDDKPGTTTQEVKKDDTPKNDENSMAKEYLKSINEETAEAKGICGPDMMWYYKENVLVIKGTGEMNDNVTFTLNGESLNPQIYRVIIDEGVTTVGAYAFSEVKALSKVILPSTLKWIGWYAFSYCSQLPEISIPESVEGIGGYAFQFCSKLTEIQPVEKRSAWEMSRQAAKHKDTYGGKTTGKRDEIAVLLSIWPAF